MERDEHGHFTAIVPDVAAGTDYVFEIPGGKQLPDPASHFQPLGVFGPSRVMDHNAFEWNDCGFPGLPLPGAVIYELHIGTFTRRERSRRPWSGWRIWPTWA